jgi:hypothetical protein
MYQLLFWILQMNQMGKKKSRRIERQPGYIGMKRA